MMPDPIVVISYQPDWKIRFEELSARLSHGLGPISSRIEHVGSTAVPGLHAKPIIDLDLVISAAADFDEVRDRLAGLGYVHIGDAGVPGREAFELRREEESVTDHHLYVCREGARELLRHLAFRDYLLAHPETAAEYGRLKCELASRFRDDREAYTDAKKQFVNDILERVARSGGSCVRSD